MGAAVGGYVAMATLTIDPKDGRLADPACRPKRRRMTVVRGADGVPLRVSTVSRATPRPRTAELLNDDRAGLIEHSLLYQQFAWNRLTANLRNRKFIKESGGLAYLRGVELQRSGMAHVHVLIRVASRADFMKLRAALRGDEAKRSRLARTDPEHRDAGLAIRAGFGKVVDVQLARSRMDVARYVTKMQDAGGASDAAAYVTKGTSAPMPRYTRRTSYGRAWAPGWVKPTPLAGFTWRLAAASIETVTTALRLSGVELIDPGSLRVHRSPLATWEDSHGTN
jgi:hypothetical protein